MSRNPRGTRRLASRAAAIAAALALPLAANPCDEHGDCKDGKKATWLAGDFHQHTLYTDGATPFDFVMSKNAEFGLDWWANSEHGGVRLTDGNGTYWDANPPYPPGTILGDVYTATGPDGLRHRGMWRWQSLRDHAFPDVVRNRALHPRKRIFSGLEWNVPGHEHCSTGIVAEDASAISAFEYQFDQSDTDQSRNGEVTPYGVLAKHNGKNGTSGKPYPDRHADAVAACAWMQEQLTKGTIDNGWIVFAHVERAGAWSPAAGGGYNVEHFRDFNSAGPDACFGFEGAPGHQVNPFRGLGNPVTCDASGACTSRDFGGTYGGVGFYSAKVGGLWDALLGEGRHFFNFASSDYHKRYDNCSGGECGDDFYPGEYQKDWLRVKHCPGERASLDDLADALRSGNSYFVQGDLIDRLRFVVRQGDEEAEMGGDLYVDGSEKKPVTVVIKFRSPKVNHAGNAPAVDHVDLVAGDITGLVAKELSPGVPNPEYANPTNKTTRVIASFTARDWETDADGFHRVVLKLKDVKRSTYFRLRGTNLGCGVPNETGPSAPLPSAEHCNPLPDALAGPNDAQKAFADLWFYSNPIFVHVR
jgi:hypothetical protein